MAGATTALTALTTEISLGQQAQRGVRSTKRKQNHEVIKGCDGCLDHKQHLLRSMARRQPSTLNIALGPGPEVECRAAEHGPHPE